MCIFDNDPHEIREQSTEIEDRAREDIYVSV